MSLTDSPAVLVARFLQVNGYNETLSALLTEANLPQDAGNAQPGDLTIEKVLEEKRIFDLSLNFEKIGVGEDEDRGWSVPGVPSAPKEITPSSSSSNILHVSIAEAHDLLEAGEGLRQVIIFTTADRCLNLGSFEQSDPSIINTVNRYPETPNSPILSSALIAGRWLVTAGMSGQLVLSDLANQRVLDQVRDHGKYVVQVAIYEEQSAGQHGPSYLIATAGWDQRVFVYRSEHPPDEDQAAHKLGNPIASITLQSNPECILFMKHPETTKPLLIISRRDSTFLYFYALPNSETSAPPPPHGATPSPPSLVLLGRQNLAPHSNAWIAFTPSAFALCPSDPTLLAVATSSVPHMKLLFVRLLIPPPRGIPASAAPQTQAAQTRETLRRADQESAAILSQTSTLAPQTPYSTPQVCWRPDGSGVWVNGDDGAVRGVESKTGKVVRTLKEGHEAGSKVRCICAGMSPDGKEILVSGGFDHRLVLWSVAEE